MLKLVEDEAGLEAGEAGAEARTLDEIAREGARRMLIAALNEEVAEFIARHRGERDENGLAMVVRNGVSKPRSVTLGAGTVTVEAPRVNDRRVDEDGNRKRFRSQILPPYMRRSPNVTETLPILYLRGLSTGDFKPALAKLFGEEASGLSSSSIARLTTVWEAEYRQFRDLRFDDRDYVYVWVDGVHFNVRLEDDRLCTLVMIGVRPDGTKELLVVEDGYRESEESWKEVLRDLKRRGMRAPVLAVGDGALGFWAAVRDVWPETRGQRDWCHKMANVLDKLPKRLQPKAKAMLRDIMYAETEAEAEERIGAFKAVFEPKQERAVKCLVKDQEALLTFFDFPAEHWKHIRTSNPIESAFATVRLRQRVTKGSGTRTKALTMAFKLLERAQESWRRIDGAAHLPAVRAGAKYDDGIRVEREDAAEDAA
jgi:putative transposase